MSFSHFDEVYDICCGLCERSEESDKYPIPLTVRTSFKERKEEKTTALWQEELSDEHLYEKV